MRGWHGVLAASLVVVAVGGGAATAAAPAADVEASASKRLVLSPAPGRVVTAPTVRLSVRANVRSVRLNGRRVGGQLGDAHRGVRTLRASLSHGLRRGGNVLRVRAGRRRATVRFVVRTPDPLVGAGLDRRVAAGGPVALRGRVRAGGEDPPLRWRIVERPRVPRADRDARPARLRSPAVSASV